MGLFSRNDTSSSSGRRSSASSDSQLSELRGRARRRLIGALALVLAVVVLVPMLTADKTPPEPEQSLALGPITQPAGQGTTQTRPGELVVQENTPTPVIEQPDEPLVADPATSSDGGLAVVDPGLQTDPAQTGTPAVPAPETSPPEPVKPVEKPKPVDKPKPAPAPAQNGRTDDGSYALALLEGRVPNKPAPAAKPAAQQGNFILQIVAYSNQNDAQSRRDQLVSAGVTNAYVETAQSGGKPTYRLRVGPFPTREAAQAAQARLRSLGYENSFISAK